MYSRQEQFYALFPQEPSFRFDQIQKDLFLSSCASWHHITTLPKPIRNQLTHDLPFHWYTLHTLFESQQKDTYKAILKGPDNLLYETVLMRNAKQNWTICVSSQIGCAMQCDFCATGTMGFKRHLSSDEIIDQYRFWNQFISTRHLPGRISNMVFMGMGEPLANYEHVKQALNQLIAHTDLGPTRITVSTVGLLPMMQHILTDTQWPHVRIAISLHSPHPEKRKQIVRTTVAGFHEQLAQWTISYKKKFQNKRLHLTFEYTLIDQVNDFEDDAIALAKYVRKTAVQKVNLIPYNPVSKKSYVRSDENRVHAFKQKLQAHQITTTIRKTMGQDINASCGQLVIQENTNECLKKTL